MRTDLANRTARVLFFLPGHHMVLVHGFVKKTRATRRADMALALERKRKMGVLHMTNTNGSNPHLGSTLDELLEEDGTLADVHATAVKRMLAWQVGQTMSDLRISKSEMARRMGD